MNSQTISVNFGKLMKRERLNKGWNLDDLSKELKNNYNCKTSISTLSRVENGNRPNTSYYIIRHVVKALNISQNEVDIALGMDTNKCNDDGVENTQNIENLLRLNKVFNNGIEVDFAKKEILIKIVNQVLNSEEGINCLKLISNISLLLEEYTKIKEC